MIHEKALVESADVGEGTRVWAFAHIMEGAVVGRDGNICDHAFIESGAQLGDRVTVKNNVLIWDGVSIGDDVFIGPNAVFTNDLVPRPLNKTAPDGFLPTIVETGVSIGANATIVCGVTLGRHSFIGAGTVVTADVPDHAVVVGNPGTQRGWICICGERLSEAAPACTCGRRYRWDGHPELVR